MLMGFILLCAGILFCISADLYLEAKIIEIEIGEVNK